MLHNILIKGFAIQGCSNQKKHESWTLGNHVVNIVKKTCRIMAFTHWETHIPIGKWMEQKISKNGFTNNECGHSRIDPVS
jgi:hypothetical protein